MSAEAKRWAWLPQFMPQVSQRLAELRRRHGPAHVAMCWKNGVVDQQPGWFFAREGVLSIGAPPTDSPDILLEAFELHDPNYSFVYLRNPEAMP
jgi:hypothetical protein